MEPDRDFYFFCRNILEAYARINNGLQVSGVENIPAAGGALLCPNHENFSDPFFLAASVQGRIIHFLAWHGLEQMPVIGPLAQRAGVTHPIRESYGVALDRDEARTVLGRITALLKAGELCAMFPEGEIKHWVEPGHMRTFKPGSVRMAARASVPIIPVGLKGTRWVVPNLINLHYFGGPDRGLWIPIALPSRVKVRFGNPFHVDPGAESDIIVRDRETQRLKRVIIDMVETM